MSDVQQIQHELGLPIWREGRGVRSEVSREGARRHAHLGLHTSLDPVEVLCRVVEQKCHFSLLGWQRLREALHTVYSSNEY